MQAFQAHGGMAAFINRLQVHNAFFLALTFVIRFHCTIQKLIKNKNRWLINWSIYWLLFIASTKLTSVEWSSHSSFAPRIRWWSQAWALSTRQCRRASLARRSTFQPVSLAAVGNWSPSPVRHTTLPSYSTELPIASPALLPCRTVRLTLRSQMEKVNNDVALISLHFWFLLNLKIDFHRFIYYELLVAFEVVFLACRSAVLSSACRAS